MYNPKANRKHVQSENKQTACTNRMYTETMYKPKVNRKHVQSESKQTACTIRKQTESMSHVVHFVFVHALSSVILYISGMAEI
jgi:hypothetical protein